MNHNLTGHQLSLLSHLVFQERLKSITDLEELVLADIYSELSEMAVDYWNNLNED